MNPTQTDSHLTTDRHQPTPLLSPRSHFENTSRDAELQIVINL